MNKVDFYILEANQSAALRFVCQLVEKRYREREYIYIHTESLETANSLDNLLWIYRDDSFLPHILYHADHHPDVPIQIGYDEIPTWHHGTLINLHNGFPKPYQQFQRIIEIVFSDPLVQQLARDRYRQYRDNGAQLTTHKEKLTTHDF